MMSHYVLSGDDGHISLTPQDLLRPFKISLHQEHPFLTLGDYFGAMARFIEQMEEQGLVPGPSQRLDPGKGPGPVQEVILCSEKHGAMYHVASVCLVCGHGSIKAALLTALSEQGHAWIDREVEALEGLHRSFGLPFLPRVYGKGSVAWPTEAGEERFFLFLTEWFEGFDEWHFSQNSSGEESGIRIWNSNLKTPFVSDLQGVELFRQASRILTCYYDVASGREIYPWRHEAGDFVVCTAGDRVEVRLITVRGYDPVFPFLSNPLADSEVRLVYFFLNLTLQMRLDRVDGTGEWIWVRDLFLRGVLQGFLDGLGWKEQQGNAPCCRVERMKRLLRSFSSRELLKAFGPLLDFHETIQDSTPFSLIQKNLEAHSRQVYQIIQESLSPAR